MGTNPAGAVYGTITAGALLAAETAQAETYLETIVAVVLFLLLYWFAHSYAGFAGDRLLRGEPISLRALRQRLARELPLLAGGAVPLAALILCGVFGASLATALNVGIWTAAAMMVLIELVAGLRADLAGGQLAFQVGVGALMGASVICLHVILH